MSAIIPFYTGNATEGYPVWKNQYCEQGVLGGVADARLASRLLCHLKERLESRWDTMGVHTLSKLLRKPRSLFAL